MGNREGQEKKKQERGDREREYLNFILVLRENPLGAWKERAEY